MKVPKKDRWNLYDCANVRDKKCPCRAEKDDAPWDYLLKPQVPGKDFPTCYDKKSVPKCGACQDSSQCSCGFCCPSMKKCRCGSGCGKSPKGWERRLPTCGVPPPTPPPPPGSTLPAGATVGMCTAKLPGWKCKGRQCTGGDMSRYMAGGAPGDCPPGKPFCMPWCLPASNALCAKPD